MRRLARNCGECNGQRSRAAQVKGRQDSRKIGLIAAIPMRPPEAGCICPAMALRVGAGSTAVCRGAGRSRRDECFSLSATRGRRLTQDRANHGNRGKAIRGGITTFSLGELNSAGGSVFRHFSSYTVTFRSASRRRRVRDDAAMVACWFGIGRGDHEMRSPGRSISIAIGRSSNGRRPTHSFGLRTHGDAG